MSAGNDLNESVALVAAANKVLQDPSQVGAALRTISLRIRGTSLKVLEEMGEETDGAIESVSKLQEKVKAISGVDILDDSGAYRDTYEILRDLAEVWDEVGQKNPKGQAALLELLAGKNRSNALAAILGNLEDLEGAYDAALDAEGSALKENEAYLDSIQGRVDLFKNSLQTMWYSELDSEFIKLVVDLGTALIKVVDTLGLLPTILAGIFTYSSVIKKSFDWVDVISKLGGGLTKFGKSIGGKFKEKVGSKDNLLSTMFGSKTDISASAKNIAYEVQDAFESIDTIDLSSLVDTTDIDLQIDVNKKELDEAKKKLKSLPTGKEGWNYYKSLGSKTPAKDRDNRIAEAQAEVVRLEKSLQDLNNQKVTLVNTGVQQLRNELKQTSQQAKDAANGFDLLKQRASLIATDRILQLPETDILQGHIDSFNALNTEAEKSKWITEHIDELNDAEVRYFSSIKEGAASVQGAYQLIDEGNAKIQQSGTGISKVLKGVGNALLSIGASIAINLALNAIIKGIDAVINRTENMLKEWENAQLEVANINSELEKTQNKIDELDAKGVLTIADKKQLELLKQENAELERRLRIAEKAEAESKKAAQAQLRKDYKKEFETGGYTASHTELDYENYDRATSVRNALESVMNEPAAKMFSMLSDAEKEAIKQTNEAVYELIKENSWSELTADEMQKVMDVFNQAQNDLQDLSFVVDGSKTISGNSKIDQLIQQIKEYKEEYNAIVNDDSLDPDEKDKKAIEISTNIEETETELANFGVTIGEYIDNYGEAADGDKVGQAFVNGLKAQMEKIDMVINPVEFYDNKFNEILGKYSEKKQDLYELAAQGKLTASVLNSADYAPLMSELNKLGITAQDVAEHIDSLSDAKVAAVIDPSFNIADYAQNLDSMQENISSWQSALESLNDGSFTYSDFIDLTQQFPELADGVDTSSKAFTGLAKNLKKAIKAAPDELVDELKALSKQMKQNGKDTSAIDQLVESCENMADAAIENVKTLASEYGTLVDKITEAKDAQNELEKAMSDENSSDAGYQTTSEAVQAMREMYANGVTGSESQIWDIFEKLAGKTYDFTKSLSENEEVLKDWINTYSRWYLGEDDGEYAHIPIENFLNDAEGMIAEAKNKGEEWAQAITWTYEDGALNIDFDNLDWDTIAKQLGVTSEAFTDLMLRVGQFFAIRWDNADDIVNYFNHINDGTRTATERLELVDESVRSFLEKEGVSESWLDGKSSEARFELLPTGVQDVLNKYYELKAEIAADPLNINAQLDQNSLKSAGELSEDSIAYLQQLTTVLKENESGTIFIDYTDLRETAKEAGYTEDAINQMIDKIKEFNNVCGIETSDTDLLGLVSLKDDVDKAKSYLDLLQIKFEEVKNADNTISFKIDVESMINALIAQGWTTESIQAYLSTLESSGSFNFTLQGEAINVNTEDAKNKINDLIIEKNKIAEGETTEYNVTGTGEETTNKIKEAWDNIPAAKSTYYTVYENVRRTGSGYYGVPRVNGTANYRGTAFANGNWGAPRSETALVGELGPEMVVRGNRWFTVGDDGAEFTDIQKGDIIFNHKQTEDLLSKGYVTGRGKAYASGTAYTIGDGLKPWEKYPNDIGYKGDLHDSSLKDASDAAKDISDEVEEVVDFIEIKLEEIEQTIAKTTAELENYVDDTSTVSEKNNLYDNLVSAEKDRANTYLMAAEEYNRKATEALKEIPAEYRKMAMNGAIAIKDFVGEDQAEIAEAINNYREWSNKADDAEVGYLESIAEQAALRVEQLQDIASDYENIIGVIETSSGLIEAHMDFVEESGKRLSATYYNKLIKNSEEQKKKLEEERKDLQRIFDRAVRSGDVEKGSDEWYEMLDTIYEVDEAIVQCDIDIEEFNNSINELKFENLEKLIDRFDDIDSQLSHLHDRFTDGKIVDDEGDWNSDGIAAIGVLTQQMEVAEMKSRQYAEAIDELKEDYKNGLYSEDEFNEKLAELTENQWDAIESYESAKDAIVDLNKTRIDAVKDGIQEEIDAYKELIDKKKEALDADKDLYDFEKNVKEQQKDIATIERKLAALSGDTSASAAAQRKVLEAELAEAKANLEDTYRDRSIENQKNALDDAYEKFEEAKNKEMEALDEYLEREDEVIGDSVDIVKEKENAKTVLEELKAVSEQYGIDISNAIVSPWEDGANAVMSYDNQFGEVSESFIAKLQAIIDKEKELQKEADNTATGIINGIEESEKDTTSAKRKSSSGGGSGYSTVVYYDEKGNKLTKSQAENILGAVGGKVYDKSGKSYDASNAKAPGSKIYSSSWTDEELAASEVGVKQGGSSKTISKGTQVTVSDKATNFSSKSGNASMASFVKGETFDVMQTSGNQVLIGKGGTATGWVDKKDLEKYAKGTTKIKDDQFAWIDEIGEELVLHAGSDGKLAYLTKGSGVIPADLTSKLMDLALDPTQTLENSRPNINAPHITNNEINIDMTFGDVVHIDTVTNDTIPDLTKAVEKQMDKYMKNLNNQIRRYAK